MLGAVLSQTPEGHTMNVTFLSCHASRVSIFQVDDSASEAFQFALAPGKNYTVDLRPSRRYRARDTDTEAVIPANGVDTLTVAPPFGYTGILPDYHMFVFIRYYGKP